MKQFVHSDIKIKLPWLLMEAHTRENPEECQTRKGGSCLHDTAVAPERVLFPPLVSFLWGPLSKGRTELPRTWEAGNVCG